MNQRQHKALMSLAVVLTVAWVLWTIYDTTPLDPADKAYIAANKYFEDGQYGDALRSYEVALEKDPQHIHALRGKARALLKMERLAEAVAVADEAILRQPEFGATYANRGIIHDFLGAHEAALRDYEMALRLDPELADGPNWLTRFLRKQAERPPSIADRARYLREQLSKDPNDRLLRVPELDARERPFKL